MSLVKRNMVLMLLLLVSAAMVFAQGTEESAAETTEINILVESGGQMLQEEAAKLYEAETGIKVNFIQVPYSGVYDKLIAEMASNDAAFDVATIDVIWIPRFANFSEPLDDLFTEEVQGDIFPALVSDAQYDGHFVGMPTWANAEILFYRSDLFNDETEKANFKSEYGYELAPPTTWAKFLDVAKFFTRDTNNDGEIDFYGCVVKGGVETEYLAHVLQAGSPGVVLDADGNIIVDNQAHIDALEFYRAPLEDKSSPLNALEIGWGEAQNLFNGGNSAMLRFWGHAYRFITEDMAVYGKVGAAPMIGGSAGVGSIPGPWFNIVPKSSKNKEAALDFVKFAYEHNELGLDAPLGLAARISAYDSYADKAGFEHFEPLIDTLNAPQTIGRPLVKNWEQINNDVVIPMLQYVISGAKTPEEATAWAREQIEALQ